MIGRAFLLKNFANKRILINQQIIRNAGSKSNQSSKSTNLILKSSAVGAIAGTAYAGYEYYNENRVASVDGKVKETAGPIIIDQKPNVRIMRKIINSKDDSGLEITLFQFQTCPFCCKVRAFLDYAGFSYNVVEVDAVLRQSIKWSPSKKVPILLVKTSDGKYVQLNDSSVIISTLASFLLDKTQNFYDLAAFYPSHTFTDDNGKKKVDIMNKYFLMQGKMSENPKNIQE